MIGTTLNVSKGESFFYDKNRLLCMGNMDIHTIVVASATVVLAIVTVWYAYTTHKMLMEVEKARKEEVQPKLWARLDFFTPLYNVLRIENIGRGPAINISVEYSVTPGGDIKKWEHPMLSTKEYQRFMLPIPEDDAYIETLVRKYEFVTVRFDYDDLNGENHKEKVSIDLKKFKDNIGTTLNEETLADQVKGIKEQLEKIHEKMGKC